MQKTADIRGGIGKRKTRTGKEMGRGARVEMEISIIESLFANH